jgi:hypothetical protein
LHQALIFAFSFIQFSACGAATTGATAAPIIVCGSRRGVKDGTCGFTIGGDLRTQKLQAIVKVADRALAL